MYYGTKAKVCNRGCKKPYKESDDDHNYAYHKSKTVALLCGCGFGDIFVSRVRKHLLEVHGIESSKKQVLVQFFWHRVPAYNAVRTCDDPQKVGCLFRSPISELVGESHICKRDLKKKLPEPDAFLKNLLPRTRKPVRGYPNIVQKYDSSPPSKKSKNSASVNKVKTDVVHESEQKSVAGRVEEDHRQPSGRQKFSRERNPKEYRSSATTSSACTSSAPKSSAKRKTPTPELEHTSEDSDAETIVSEAPSQGTAVPSDYYKSDGEITDEDEEVDLNNIRNLKIQISQHMRDEYWGSDNEEAKKRYTPTRGTPSQQTSSAMGSASKQPDSAAKRKRTEKPQEVQQHPQPEKKDEPVPASEEDSSAHQHEDPSAGAGGHPPCREAYAPNWSKIDKLKTFKIPKDVSTYTMQKKTFNIPDFSIVSGLMCYKPSANIKRTNVRFNANKALHPGLFLLVDKEGSPFCYATITMHKSNPNRTEEQRLWDQFNPMNYPCFCEVVDLRARPQVITHIIAFSLPVTSGEFGMTVLPRNDQLPDIRVIFTQMKDFGVAQHLQWKK